MAKNNWWNWINFNQGPLGYLRLSNREKYNKDPSTYTTNNAAGTLMDFLTGNWNHMSENNQPAAKDLGSWFKTNYVNDTLDPKVSEYLNNLSDADLGSLIIDNGYYNLDADKERFTGYNVYTLDTDNLLNEISKLASIPDAPTMYDSQAIIDEANKQIDDENANILAMYDKDLNTQRQIYNQQMNTINQGYNQYAKSLLANEYQKNAQLMGTLSTSLDKSRRNALEAGANAGLRIAGNINTVLNAQNKQTAQSLETSNALAQRLLNQQNAALGIQGAFSSTLSNDTSRRASLASGTVERKQNAANSAIDIADTNYSKQMDRYNDVTAASRNSTPFSDSYINYRKQKANIY